MVSLLPMVSLHASAAGGASTSPPPPPRFPADDDMLDQLLFLSVRGRYIDRALKEHTSRLNTSLGFSHLDRCWGLLGSSFSKNKPAARLYLSWLQLP
jgi:hypothetical protein